MGIACEYGEGACAKAIIVLSQLISSAVLITFGVICLLDVKSEKDYL